MSEFKNPNSGGAGGSGGGDNTSMLVMMAVMVAIIFGMQYYRRGHSTPTAPPSAPVAQQTGVSPANTPAPQLGTMAAAPAAGQGATAAPHTPAIQGTSSQPIVVENEVYRITFDTRGADVTSWILKKYKDDAGKPLDIVHEAAAKQFGYPMSLYTYDRGLTAGLAQALYVPSTTGTVTTPGSLSFRYAVGNVAVTKTFGFDRTSYVITADTLVTVNGAPVRSLVSWPAGLGDTDTAAAYAGAQIDTSVKGKDEHDAFKKISNGNTLVQPFDWAGISDGYFATIFLPQRPDSSTVVTFHDQIEVTNLQRGSSNHSIIAPTSKNGASKVPVVGAAIGDTSGHTQTAVFVGPKAVGVLRSVKSVTGQNLEGLLDFGFFGFIGKYLFLALRGVHSLIAPKNVVAALSPSNWSWGWAIILLTVVINLVLLPLRVKGMQSMLKMQRLQPQQDAIKAKYKNPKPTDPKTAAMNAEIMALQKENGVSMFGGCVPTLIQLPLLFAFFTMLTRVVELRQAHWGWLHDLSAADPYHILPITMVITSFLVQYYTPSPGVDPQQQKMMAFMMPAFSGYICWSYASGLALYWVVGNFIMIAQQAVMNRTPLGREIRQMQLERAAKKASGTRTIQGRR